MNDRLRNQEQRNLLPIFYRVTSAATLSAVLLTTGAKLVGQSDQEVIQQLQKPSSIALSVDWIGSDDQNTSELKRTWRSVPTLNGVYDETIIITNKTSDDQNGGTVTTVEFNANPVRNNQFGFSRTTYNEGVTFTYSLKYGEDDVQENFSKIDRTLEPNNWVQPLTVDDKGFFETEFLKKTPKIFSSRITTLLLTNDKTS